MAASIKITKSLPDDFAATVMEIEMNIEAGKFDAESVNK